MINLTNRTEYSIRFAAGKINRVLDRQEGEKIAGICDRDSTWGHVRWQKECKKRGIETVFGVEIRIVENADERTKQGTFPVKFIAKNQDGLAAIYEANSVASEKFYYIPRLDWDYVENELLSNPDVFVILNKVNWPKLLHWNGWVHNNVYFEVTAATTSHDLANAKRLNLPLVCGQDAYYPEAEDRGMYEMVMGKLFTETRPTPMHLLTQGEWLQSVRTLGLSESEIETAIYNSWFIGQQCVMQLETANIVKPEKPETLRKMCEGAAKRRKINLKDPIYKARLDYELKLIDDKKFEDYFYIVSDMVRYAKRHMFVGPARGSSCGSLVCYLLDITDVDPIPYDLLFERFIDINREDYPDIDIDFPDSKREMVFTYLGEKYGFENVARIGTVSMFKPKSAITDVSKALGIPAYEVKDLKDSILERSGGDARAAYCILDTFNDTDLGRKMIAKYPELMVCAEMEAHARHTGVHAAGIFLSDRPVTRFCTIDEKTGCAQIDKYDAESLNLLKIDALGLRTLTVLDDCLDQIGKKKEWLITYPNDDLKAFQILNDGKFSGIFQFEGASLKILMGHMTVENIEVIIAATALARPGPLASGGSYEFYNRKAGKKPVLKIHPIIDAITEPTYGIVVYQEQVMRVARELGELSWEDVSNLRKAMSKSMGKEFFDKFYAKFLIGARKQGLEDEKIKEIWDTINTMGSWAFNRSHAVAYGLVSYWCCVLKAHYPLEFALACLKSAKDDEQTIYILRELVEEGFKYVPYDKDKSAANWTAQDGMLVGGLTGIKGCGAKMASEILEKRSGKNKKPLTKTQQKVLDSGVTPWDSVYACDDQWGHIKENPGKYQVSTKIYDINELNDESNGTYLVIGRLKRRKTRDANEALLVENRGGKKLSGPTIFANLVIEDDTGEILAGIGRLDFPKLGPEIIETAKVGDWYLWKGNISKGFRRINITRYKRLTDNPEYAKPGVGLDSSLEEE